VTEQNQKAGHNSTNIQAHGSVVIHQGLTIANARQIALDVFRENYLSLSGDAADLARLRAEEITEKFLKDLQEQNPEGVKQAGDPDFQHAIFTVQKEYARCGDKELGDLLVDLLVDRTKQSSRSILQIVLNESLSVAPKLTQDQISALSLVFLFRYTINYSVKNLASLDTFLDHHVAPFIEVIEKKEACYQHLEYSGCGTVGLGSLDLSEVFRRNYAGLFSKGFDETQFQAKQMTIPYSHPIFIRCLHDGAKKQVNAMNEDVIKEVAAQQNIIGDDVNKLVSLTMECLMSQEEAKKFVIGRRGYMERLFDVWETSSIKHFTLTSVGIAIGHANVKKNVGEFTNLSIWIN
jgi:hypothetical protein